MNSELESIIGKRLSKLLNTLETYGKTGDIKETARIIGTTPKNVANRLAVVVQEFENAKKFLQETEKYQDVLFRRESVHSKKIGSLCQLGHALGYQTWIAINERDYFYYDHGEKRILGDLSDFWKKPKLLGVNGTSWHFMKFIDVMWIRDQRIHYAFEVETSKSFTKAFDRCSNIPQEHHTAKVFVIPRNDERALLLSIQSNLISHAISSGNWYFLTFDALDDFKKSKAMVTDAKFMRIARHLTTTR